MRFVLCLLALVPAIVFGYKFDSDVPEAVKSQITTDMAFMGTLRSENVSPLHQEIFGKIDGGYVKWFESRVTAVGLNSCGSANAVACVIPFFNPSKIWLTKNYTNFSHPQIAKMMVVFHEARHTESEHGNWSHASCPSPFKDPQGNDMKSIWTGAKLAGEPACDVTPYGSYGSSMIMLKNVAKFCTNCTDKVKMDAGIYADDQFLRVTSEDAIAKIQKDLYASDSVL